MICPWKLFEYVSFTVFPPSLVTIQSLPRIQILGGMGYADHVYLVIVYLSYLVLHMTLTI